MVGDMRLSRTYRISTQPQRTENKQRSCCIVHLRTYIGLMALRGHQTNLTMTVAPDPIGNDAWPSVIKTPPVDCRRRCLGTLHIKGLIARGNFAAQ